MDPHGSSNRTLRSRRSSNGGFAQETVDTVFHVLLRLLRYPAHVVLLLQPGGDLLNADAKGVDDNDGVDCVDDGADDAACW